MSGNDNPRKGKHLSNETRKKISNSHKGLLSGEKNPMYGKKRPDLSRRNLENGYEERDIQEAVYQIVVITRQN